MVSNEEQGVRREPLVQQGKIEAADLGLARLIPRTGGGQKTRAAEDAAGEKNSAKYDLHGPGGTGNECLSRHQATLRAICKIRGSPSVPVILPKFGFVRPVTGLLMCVA